MVSTQESIRARDVVAERTFEWYAPTITEEQVTEVQPHDCSVCGAPIPLDRLEALPHTRTCVHHSDEQAKIVFDVYSHKTAPTLVIVDPTDKEALRRAQRAHRRAR